MKRDLFNLIGKILRYFKKKVGVGKTFRQHFVNPNNVKQMINGFYVSVSYTFGKL